MPQKLCAPKVIGKVATSAQPFQAEPRAFQPPKPSAQLSALPSTSSSTSILHLKPQDFTFCPFPPAPLSHAGRVGSSTLCPDAQPRPGPREAKSTPADPTKAGICSPVVMASPPHLSGHGYLARTLQEFPGASQSSQPSLCSTSQCCPSSPRYM